MRKHQSGRKQSPEAKLVLAADLGGTYTNIALAWAQNRQVGLIASFHFRTQAMEDLYPPLREVTAYGEKKYGIRVEHAALGVAGPIRGRIVKLTNAPLSIHASSHRRRLGLKTLLLMNDFDAIGYGVNFLRRGDFLPIPARGGIHPARNRFARAIIGAGTGLGKSILVYDRGLDLYLPHPSEGGHVDFPATTPWEQDLIDFIKAQDQGGGGRSLMRTFFRAREWRGSTSFCGKPS